MYSYFPPIYHLIWYLNEYAKDDSLCVIFFIIDKITKHKQSFEEPHKIFLLVYVPVPSSDIILICFVSLHSAPYFLHYLIVLVLTPHSIQLHLPIHSLSYTLFLHFLSLLFLLLFRLQIFREGRSHFEYFRDITPNKTLWSTIRVEIVGFRW